MNIVCAACVLPAEGDHGIHRDGFDEGPEVWLCNTCGSGLKPTCEELWEQIAQRYRQGLRIDYIQKEKQ